MNCNMAHGQNQWTKLKKQADTGEPAAVRAFEEFKQRRRESARRRKAELDEAAERAAAAANRKEAARKCYEKRMARVRAGDPEAVAAYRRHLQQIKDWTARKKSGDKAHTTAADTDEDYEDDIPIVRTGGPNLRPRGGPVHDEAEDRNESLSSKTLEHSTQSIDQPSLNRDANGSPTRPKDPPRKSVQRSIEAALVPPKSGKRTKVQLPFDDPDIIYEHIAKPKRPRKNDASTDVMQSNIDIQDNERLEIATVEADFPAPQPKDSTELVDGTHENVKVTPVATQQHDSRIKQQDNVPPIKQESSDIISVEDEIEEIPKAAFRVKHVEDLEELELQLKQAEAEKRAAELQLKIHRAKKTRT